MTLHEMRIAKGLSMRSLAKKSGVSVRSIFRAEHGKVKTSELVMSKLKEALK